MSGAPCLAIVEGDFDLYVSFCPLPKDAMLLDGNGECRARREALAGWDERLSPRAAMLVIAGMSLALWSALISVAVRIF